MGSANDQVNADSEDALKCDEAQTNAWLLLDAYLNFMLLRKSLSSNRKILPVRYHELGSEGSLSAILLDDLDKELEKCGHQFVRYADDFIIMVRSLSAGQRVMDSIRRFLERELRLRGNEKKSR